ncbi:MAG: hypothetical protein ACPL88_05335, partial [Bryobacteraceae bacterium]
MNRRRFVQAVWALPAIAAPGARVTVRGALEHGRDGEPRLRTAAGETLALEGDEDTMKVLRDRRLAGRQLEITGTRTGQGRFRAGPFYEKNVLVVERGSKYLVTYWCDVCS